MRKEILLAIIAGGGFGLLIAFGVWKLNTNLHSSPVKVDNSTSTPTDITGSPSPSAQTQTGQLKVVLVRPDNLAVFTDSQTNVTGATKQNVFVVVSGVDNDDITNSSDSGSFTSNVTLEAGTNQITATAFDSTGDEADTNLILVYSSQFVPDTNSASVAYLGTVTDISDSVIQIKDAAGNIEQIKATVDAHFIDTRASLNKEIKSTDIAIGDYLVALGVKGANNILSSSRILVTDSLVKPTRRAFYGVVTDDSGINKFVMKNPKTGEIITVTPGTGVTISGIEKSFGKITNNEKVIAVGEFKDGVMTARTIEVLK